MKLDKDLKTNLQTTDFELLVPANNKNIAIKAINIGADAIYIGYQSYGARAQAGNSIEDIIEIIEYAHKYRVKVYVTLNTILKNEELAKVEKLIHHLYFIKADGIIIQDMGILELNLPPIPIIASTQCHNNTIQKIKFLEYTGFQRVILPREISLDEIKEIKKCTDVELESFVHGALCMSYSGQCYLSYHIGGRSANRGECAQPCRKLYSLKDSDGKYILRNKYILSLKDFNLSNKLEDLILAGVTSFKIEGRLKNETYVVNTTAFYRKKLDIILNNYGLKRSSQGVSKFEFEPNPYKTFNRNYTEFYINGEKKNIATIDYTSSLGEYVGIVQAVKKNYFSMNTNILNNGDGICFFNEQKNLVGTNVNKTEGNIVYPQNIKGIKEGIKIYRNYNKDFDNKLENINLVRKIPVSLKVKELEKDYMFILTDDEGNSSVILVAKLFENAINEEKAINTLSIQLSKSGNTEFEITKTIVDLKTIPFLRVSEINKIRRELTEKLQNIRRKNYKYKYRLKPINKIEYPIKKLDYRANIFNEKSIKFYKDRGCEITELALETQKKYSGKELMISKYCIKNQLGICPKQTIVKKYTEPFILIDEFNKEYLVEFDCKECVMKIKMKD